MQTGDNLSEKRLEICKKCPLYKESELHGPVCNKRKFINENDEVSNFPKQGYVRGCGCRLKIAVTQIEHHCPIKKW